MFTKSVTVNVNAPRSAIYAYLKTRYQSPVYRNAELDAKGYVPDVQLKRAERDSSLEFWVKARDPLLRISYGGWTWGYELRSLSEGQTEVRIWYRYGLFMALACIGTIGLQASNEISGTVLALVALEKAYAQPVV